MIRPRQYHESADQDVDELVAFAEVLRTNNVTSYLEIGSRYGGSLWRIGRSLPAGSRICCIELPHGKGETALSLSNCCSELRLHGYEVHSLVGVASQDARAVEWAKKHAPFDAIFVDANHTYPCVKADWENYGPLGKLIAFHDIGWRDRPGREGRLPIEVPKLWEEIKIKAEFFQEIRSPKSPRDNGIGITSWTS